MLAVQSSAVANHAREQVDIHVPKYTEHLHGFREAGCDKRGVNETDIDR